MFLAFWSRFMNFWGMLMRGPHPPFNQCNWSSRRDVRILASRIIAPIHSLVTSFHRRISILRILRLDCQTCFLADQIRKVGRAGEHGAASDSILHKPSTMPKHETRICLLANCSVSSGWYCIGYVLTRLPQLSLTSLVSLAEHCNTPDRGVISHRKWTYLLGLFASKMDDATRTESVVHTPHIPQLKLTADARCSELCYFHPQQMQSPQIQAFCTPFGVSKLKWFTASTIRSGATHSSHKLVESTCHSCNASSKGTTVKWPIV